MKVQLGIDRSSIVFFAIGSVVLTALCGIWQHWSWVETVFSIQAVFVLAIVFHVIWGLLGRPVATLMSKLRGPWLRWWWRWWVIGLVALSALSLVIAEAASRWAPRWVALVVVYFVLYYDLFFLFRVIYVLGKSSDWVSEDEIKRLFISAAVSPVKLPFETLYRTLCGLRKGHNRG